MVETLRSSIDVLNLQLTMTLELLVGKLSILWSTNISYQHPYVWSTKDLPCSCQPSFQRMTKTNSIAIHTWYTWQEWTVHVREDESGDKCIRNTNDRVVQYICSPLSMKLAEILFWIISWYLTFHFSRLADGVFCQVQLITKQDLCSQFWEFISFKSLVSLR